MPPSALSPIPAPGDLFSLLLRLVFGQGIVVFVILSIFALQAWYATLTKTAKATKSVAFATREAVSNARKLDHINRIFVAATTMTMIVSQFFWLVMNFVIGNLLSAVLDVNRVLHDTLNSTIPSWGQFMGALRWDAASQLYELFSLAGLAASYLYAKRRRTTDGLSALFAIPGYIYGFCGLVGGTLSLGLDGLDNLGHQETYAKASLIMLMYGAGVAGVLYVIGCRWLFRSPALVRDMWSDRNDAPTPSSQAHV